MKTKLLRKIRKQYSIIHHPKGYRFKSGAVYLKNTYILFFNGEILRAEFDKSKLTDYMIQHLKRYNKYANHEK